MKKLLPILLGVALLLNSCIKDDMDACAGYMHIYFSYIYGGANRFFETVSTPTQLHFYKQKHKYRELEIGLDEVGLTEPYRFLKTFDDIDSLELIAWTHDEAIDYVDTPDTPIGEGYVKLKEITDGSGICRPVDDLLYGRIAIDAGLRENRNIVTIPFVRAVCRTRITMIPQTVEDKVVEEGGTTRATSSIIPSPEDFKFHLYGTRSGVDYNNKANTDEVILEPECYYEESTGNVLTPWFGSFSSEGKYLKVNVFIRDEQVASFDCAPIELTSVPGNFIDLVIDGHYVKPVMQVRVNGWKVATIESNM